MMNNFSEVMKALTKTRGLYDRWKSGEDGKEYRQVSSGGWGGGGELGGGGGVRFSEILSDFCSLKVLNSLLSEVGTSGIF